MRVFLIAIALCCVVAAYPASAVTIPDGSVIPETGISRVSGHYLAPFAVSESSGATYGEIAEHKTIFSFDNWSEPGEFELLEVGAFRLVDLGDHRERDQAAGAADYAVGIGDALAGFSRITGGLVADGLDNRLASSSYLDGSYSNWIADGSPLDARVLVCPVVDESHIINGQRERIVVGFTAFYVDAWNHQTDLTLTGAFVSAMSPDVLETMVTPEPSGLLALFAGAGGVLGYRRMRRR